MGLAMRWDEWVAHDATALAARVRQGEVSAAELAAQAVQGIEQTDPTLDAVIEVFDDVVADPLRDGMDPAGVFAGVPYLMKDLGPQFKGRLQECGSKMMLGTRATADTFLASQIRKAGLNVIGRTTTPEFGVCSASENELYVTRNPWNTDYTTCGSSSGSAAMVGAGVLPMAHGSDGGGSIRIPAGCNGALGLKVSRGVFSLAPGLSDLSGLVSIQGCLSRTVRDTAAFVDHCRGGAPGEFMPFWSPAESYTSLIERDPQPLRIALSAEWGDYQAVPHFVQELEKAGALLQSLGHHVEWVTPDVDFRAAYKAQTLCYISNFAQVIQGHLKRLGMERPDPALLEPIDIKIWEHGLDTSFGQRHDMQAVFNTTSRAFGRFFERWDIILTPVVALPTPRIGESENLTSSQNPSVLDWFDINWHNFAFTPLANLAGLPGLSMPLGQQQSGLPLGIQALGKPANDGLLLQLAAQVERALDGRWNGGRTPAVHVTRS